MLVETEARGERKVPTDADKHPAPGGVIDIEVVLIDPPLGELQMPPVVRLLADGDQPPRRFPRFEDGDDLVGFGVSEIGLDERVARVTRRVEEGGVPRHGSVFHPVVVLPGNVAQ